MKTLKELQKLGGFQGMTYTEERTYWFQCMIKAHEYGLDAEVAVIVKEIGYSGCIPIVVYCVQVRKDKRLSSEWVNVKGFDTYRKARELLHVLNGD